MASVATAMPCRRALASSAQTCAAYAGLDQARHTPRIPSSLPEATEPRRLDTLLPANDKVLHDEIAGRARPSIHQTSR